MRARNTHGHHAYRRHSILSVFGLKARRLRPTPDRSVRWTKVVPQCVRYVVSPRRGLGVTLPVSHRTPFKA